MTNEELAQAIKTKFLVLHHSEFECREGGDCVFCCVGDYEFPNDTDAQKVYCAALEVLKTLTELKGRRL